MPQNFSYKLLAYLAVVLQAIFIKFTLIFCTIRMDSSIYDLKQTNNKIFMHNSNN
jgi:hypothetical protein